MIASPVHKMSAFKKQVKYGSLKRLDHRDIIKNVFIGLGCKAIGVYNLPRILTGSHQHKERKARLTMKKKGLKNKIINKTNLEKELKGYSPNC